MMENKKDKETKYIPKQRISLFMPQNTVKSLEKYALKNKKSRNLAGVDIITSFLSQKFNMDV